MCWIQVTTWERHVLVIYQSILHKREILGTPTVLFSSILMILCFRAPFSLIFGPLLDFSHILDSSNHLRRTFISLYLSPTLILHNREILAHQLHYFPRYCRFDVLWPPSVWFLVPYLILCALKSSSFLRRAWISLYLLPSNLHYIMEKFGHSTCIILVNIAAFMLWPSFQLDFWSLTWSFFACFGQSWLFFAENAS